MKNTIRKFGLVAFAAAFVLLPSVGCRKKKDTIVNIYVRNASNAYVEGAYVVLSAQGSLPNTLDPQWENFKTYTNSAGVATFNFNEIYELGQAGVAVANIEASKAGNTGNGVIKVEQETTSEETVYI